MIPRSLLAALLLLSPACTEVVDTLSDARPDGPKAELPNDPWAQTDEGGADTQPEPEPEPEPDLAPDVPAPEPQPDVPEPEPRPDVPEPGPDIAGPEPEPDVPGPDAAQPEPDPQSDVPAPDIAEPEPDGPVPEPDVPEPEPDVPDPLCQVDADCEAWLGPGPCQLAECSPDDGSCHLITAPAGTTCDDGQSCTVGDACQAGVCVGTPTPGAPCDDGDPCTSDVCGASGTCEATIVPFCSVLFDEAFDCGAVSGWYFSQLEGDVGWAVDGLPEPPAYHSADCSLNLNDDAGSYGSTAGATVAAATSPPVSLEGVVGAWLAYWDLWDTQEGPVGVDLREVQVSGDAFATWTSFHAGHVRGSGLDNSGAWHFRTLDLGPFIGQTVQVRFWFDTVDGIGNAGVGWFVDDLTITTVEPGVADEDCSDGADNDLDGLPDCFDAECADTPLCSEVGLCTDGADSDGDGATDCADPDCDADPACHEGPATCSDGADNDGDGAPDCADSDCVLAPACNGLGDTCEVPFFLGFPDNQGGSTNSATNHYTGLCPTTSGTFGVGGGAKDVVYSLIPSAGGNMTISAESGEFDGWVYLLSACAGLETTCLGASQLGTPLNLSLKANTAYYVVVDGASSAQSGSYSLSIALAGESDCGDAADNDGNGQVDCDDPACALAHPCLPEDCFDQVDNDGDGVVDCADNDCAQACDEALNCLDTLDNDHDTLADCFDPDCAGAPGCGCLSSADCDDGDACTVDSCDTYSTACKNVASPAACDDGDICTLDSCDPAAGCTHDPIPGCGVALPYQDGFACGPTEWQAEILEGTVGWAIDALPDPPGFYSAACSLNFNDDLSGFLSADGAPSAAQVTSPVFDATPLTTLWLSYVDLWDTGDSPNGTYDLREIRVSTDGFETFTSFSAEHAFDSQGQWRYRAIDLSELAGTKLQIRFWFDSVDAIANEGAGWFVDDLLLAEQPAPQPTEDCDDGVDNSLDGATDCADPACVGTPTCPESAYCADGVDNDGDALVDCADPDCVGAPECPESGANCFDGVDNDGDGALDCLDPECAGVVFGANRCCQSDPDCDDGDVCTADFCPPATLSCANLPAVCDDGVECTADSCDPGLGCVFAPDDLSCDDGDWCTLDSCSALAGCSSQSVPGCPFAVPYTSDFACGDAAWATQVVVGTVNWGVDGQPDPPAFVSPACSLNFNDDTPSFASPGGPSSAVATSPAIVTSPGQLWLSYTDWWDTGDTSGGSYDQREIRVSDDGFETWTSYPAGHTGADQSQWVARSVDLSAHAGQTIQIRFWFDSVDALYNEGVGWFIDDLSLTETQ